MKNWFLFLLLLIISAAGCESLRQSKPIMPIKEYERMLVGRLDADYMGNKRCLEACHFHDRINRDFEASTMGAQLSPKSGLPMVDCESCHGPGSLAVEGLTPEKVAEDAKQGKQTACDYKTFIDLKDLPKTAQSLLCNRCHTANATFNLHAWNMGAHALSDVSCFDCHNVHVGPDLIVSPLETADMCLKCHQKVRAEFSLPSRHPLKDKLFCTDCHDPHGTLAENLLREDSIKETCTKCHGEYEGPYVFEHADLTEDCLSCHGPHGTPNNNHLKVREPFLCLQCHLGHRTSSDPSTLESKGAFYTRCTECHSQIHGTDLPSTSGRGLFTQ
jgi:DmsE family decaheme c-type cytochrome